MHTTAALQRKEQNKSPEVSSSKAHDKHLNLKEEVGSEAGVPLCLQRSALTIFTSPPPIQRQPIEEEEELQETPIFPKLTVGAPDDEYERQADQVAENVIRMPDSDTSQIFDEEKEYPEQNGVVRTKPITPLYIQLQHSCLECDEELQQSTSNPPNVQTKSTNSFFPSKKVTKILQSPCSGSPLPKHVRSKVEPALGSDLSHVKVHSDIHSNQAAQSINAKAFTHQSNIYLGKGQSASDVPLMAHESTHVVQQTGGIWSNVHFHPDAVIQREDGVESITITVGAEQIGLTYPELRQVISEDQWNGLNNAAQLRSMRQRERQNLEVDSAEHERLIQASVTEILLPVSSLLRPQPGTSNDYPAGLFNAMVSHPSNAYLHGSIVSAEMARRWVELNQSVVDGEVRVALIDPAGELDGPPALTFQVQGHPIATQDGALYILVLDRAFPTVEHIREEMAEDLQSMERGVNLAILVNRLIEHGRRMNRIGHRAFSGDEVTAWTESLEEAQQRITRFRSEHEYLSGLLDEAESNLSDYIESEARPFATTHETFLQENMPGESYGEFAVRETDSCIDTQDRLMREGGFWNMLAAGQIGQSCSSMAQGYGTAQLLTFGYVEQSRQWHQAFRGGHISLNAFERGMESAATRALIVGGVTVVLTIATIGLAGPVLGTSASVGSQMLYWGGTAAATTALSMSASSLYTSSISMGEPYAEQIWQQGYYTPERIFWSSLLSFGIGAAIAGAGGLLSWLSRGTNTQAARALAVASAEGRVIEPPAGVQVREVSRGVVEISISGQPGKIRVTPEGFRVITPAGRGEATIAEFSWQESALATELAQQSPALAGLRDIAAVQPLGGQPFAFGVTQEGWIVMAPRTSTPLSTGLWGEMAGAGGATSIVPYGGSTALALPSRGGVPAFTAGGASPFAGLSSGTRALPGGPAPMLPGPTFIDIQGGTPFFMSSMVAASPGSRGIVIESADWMIGYQNVTTINPRDLALSRTFVRSMSYWPPSTSGRLVAVEDLPEFAGLGPDVYMNPSAHLFPQTGPVRVVPEAFFPPVGHEGRLLPIAQTDVAGITPSTHPQLHGTAQQIFWRRPFALQAADQPTQAAMGQELNRMLLRNGFIEFRLLRPGDRHIIHRIAAEIPNHRIVDINAGTISRFLVSGTVPSDPEAVAILRAAERDLRGEFSPLGEGPIRRIIRIYKQGD